MKKLILIIFVLGITLFAQSQSIAKKMPLPVEKVRNLNDGIVTSGLSPRTAFLVHKLDSINAKSYNSSILPFKLVNKGGKNYVNVFLKTNREIDLTSFANFTDYPNGIKTGLVDINKIEKLANIDGVVSLKVASKAKLLMDDAMLSTGVDRVHTGFNLPQTYSGKDVIVGIIDVGFDFTHPAFYDTSGSNYRVKKVWNQNTTIGTPPSGFAYGEEIVGQNNIMAAQTDNNSESHGTHVAGIAAGSGVGTNELYKGVAFTSDLVLVSTDMTDVGIADAVNYIFQYATSVSKPCVINISIGGHLGPHDGTSDIDQVFDNLTGAGKLIVGAAGNEGLDSIHITKTFTATDTILYSFVRFPSSSLWTDGAGLIDIWGESNKSFSVAVNIYNTNTDQFEDYTPYISSNSSSSYNYTLHDNDPFFVDDCIVEIASEININNNKPNVSVAIDNRDQDDDYRWALIEIIAKNTTVKMWSTASDFTANSYPLPVSGGSNNSTVGEIGGVGNSIISVGAYTTKNNYTSYTGNPETIEIYAANGEIAPFSSHGPTADNRTKPDITAPGNVIVAPVNRFDSNYPYDSKYTVAAVTDGTNNWYYGAMQGTSMASPMVTGIMALWLEENPNLTPAQALQIIKNTSKTDNYTGSIGVSGDNTWGWGKIDAYQGLMNIVSIEDVELIDNSIDIYPNPSKGDFTIDSKLKEKLDFEVIDVYGRVVKNENTILVGKNRFNFNDLPNGLYFAIFKYNGSHFSKRFIISK